jgi:hypothetical protein
MVVNAIVFFLWNSWLTGKSERKCFDAGLFCERARISTRAVIAIESDSFDSGRFGSDSFDSNSFDSGRFGSDSFDSDSFDSGRFGLDSFDIEGTFL